MREKKNFFFLKNKKIYMLRGYFENLIFKFSAECYGATAQSSDKQSLTLGTHIECDPFTIFNCI